MNNFYFNPAVQLNIDNSLKKIRGHENVEDARQEAYLAIASEKPQTEKDAVSCVVRAIERARWHYRKGSGKTAQYIDELGIQGNWHDSYNENDKEFLELSRMDYKLFMDTEAHPVPHLPYNVFEIDSERQSARDRGCRARARNR